MYTLKTNNKKNRIFMVLMIFIMEYTSHCTVIVLFILYIYYQQQFRFYDYVEAI